MEHILLTEEQVSKLLENRELNYFSKNDEKLELTDENSIRLNRLGDVYELKNINLDFEKLKFAPHVEQRIKRIRKWVCDHFNLTSEDVVFRSFNEREGEYLFYIRFSPVIETILLVTPESYIIRITPDSDDKQSQVRTDTQISYYRRLSSSKYYFRWLTGII